MLKKLIQTLSLLLLSGILLPGMAQRSKQNAEANARPDLKFLDNIVVEVPTAKPSPSDNTAKILSSDSLSFKKTAFYNNTASSLENASSLQFKYALLLNLEVEEIQNISLFKVIDEWMGTRYRLGGATKNGIDCSAFMQVLFASIYGITLPRTAREQYSMARRISRTELKEGDLVFFNTKGGISHVGMYLQNNKFVHASSSGVTISDLYDDYWSRKFIGVRRIDVQQQSVAINTRP